MCAPGGASTAGCRANALGLGLHACQAHIYWIGRLGDSRPACVEVQRGGGGEKPSVSEPTFRTGAPSALCSNHYLCRMPVFGIRSPGVARVSDLRSCFVPTPYQLMRCLGCRPLRSPHPLKSQVDFPRTIPTPPRRMRVKHLCQHIQGRYEPLVELIARPW
jgi:hypothetical protein